MANSPDKVAYDAFISYSQRADAALGTVLQNGLQRFAKAWYRRRALRIFRDATALAPDAPLSEAIAAAIEQSDYFILLASPEAAASPWVQRELDVRQRQHGVDRLLLVLTGGTLNWSDAARDFDPENSSALPRSLFGAFDAEPLFIDLREVADTPAAARNDPRIQDAIATLAAVIHQRPKDDLVGEDLVQHRRTLRIAWGAAGLLAVLAIATSLVSVWAIQQRDIAETRERQARAGQLASDASRLLGEQPEELELATLLAIESLRLAPSGNGQRVLAAAARLLPGRVAESFGGQVFELAFSPDKRWLARGDSQMGVMLWDLDTGEIPQLSTPAEIVEQLQVRDLAFSRDSKWLAIASGGPAARVYDLPDGEHEWHFEHADTVVTVAFDPAGKRLATGAKDGRLRVWDVATQSLLLDEDMTSEEVRAVSFSPDGSLVGAVATNGPIRLFATDNWQEFELEPVEPAEGLALAFSPDGNQFAATRANRAVIWSLDDGRVLNTVEHSDYGGNANMAFDTHIWALLFSPDSQLLVTSGRDRTTRFWRPGSGEEVMRLTHRTSVENVAFTADGKRAATAGYGLVQLWSLPGGQEILRMANDGGNAMALSEDGALIAAGGSQYSVRVMRTASATRARQFRHSDDVLAVACHPERPLIATADDDHNVQIRDTATGQVLASANLFGARYLEFARDDRLFIGSQGVFSRLGVSGDLENLVSSDVLEFALHRNHVAVRLRSGSVLAWPTTGEAGPLEIDANAHSDLRFNRDGTLLLTQRLANNQATVHAWDVRTGKESWQVAVESAFGNRLAANSAGDILAVASLNELSLLGTGDGRVRSLEFDDEIRGLVFVGNGSRLAVLLDRELATYDVENLAQTPVRIRQDNTISFAAFNDDRDLVTTTTGRSVAVWNLASGERLAEWTTGARVSQLCFLAGDDAVVTGDDDNLATVQPWRTTTLVESACASLTRNLTAAEWSAYLPGLAYQATCPDLEPLSRERLVEAMDLQSPPDPTE